MDTSLSLSFSLSLLSTALDRACNSPEATDCCYVVRGTGLATFTSRAREFLQLQRDSALKRKPLGPTAPPNAREVCQKIPSKRYHSTQPDLSNWKPSFFWVHLFTTAIICAFSWRPVPISGRIQLDIVKKAWIQEAEQEVSNELRENYGPKFLPSNDEKVKKLQAVFDRLIAFSGLDNISWDLRLIMAPGKPSLKYDSRAYGLVMFRTWELDLRLQ